MLDIKTIRENPSLVQRAMEARGADVDLDALLRLDKERRTRIGAVEDLTAERVVVELETPLTPAHFGDRVRRPLLFDDSLDAAE